MTYKEAVKQAKAALEDIETRGASKYKLCHTTIEDLFKNYNGEYTHKEIDWGEPVGNEVW